MNTLRVASIVTEAATADSNIYLDFELREGLGVCATGFTSLSSGYNRRSPSCGTIATIGDLDPSFNPFGAVQVDEAQYGTSGWMTATGLRTCSGDSGGAVWTNFAGRPVAAGLVQGGGQNLISYASVVTGSNSLAFCPASSNFVDMGRAMDDANVTLVTGDVEDIAVQRAALSFYARILGRYPTQAEVGSDITPAQCQARITELANDVVSALADNRDFSTTLKVEKVAGDLIRGFYNAEPTQAQISDIVEFIAKDDGTADRAANATQVADKLINDPSYSFNFEDRFLSKGPLGMTALCDQTATLSDSDEFVEFPPFTSVVATASFTLETNDFPEPNNSVVPGESGSFQLVISPEIDAVDVQAGVSFPQGLSITSSPSACSEITDPASTTFTCDLGDVALDEAPELLFGFDAATDFATEVIRYGVSEGNPRFDEDHIVAAGVAGEPISITLPDASAITQFGFNTEFAADGSAFLVSETNGEAVYYYRYGNGEITQTKIENPGKDFHDFGRSIAISPDGRTVVVGANWYEPPGGLDEFGRGAIYVFTIDDAGLVESELLVRPGEILAGGMFFGDGVAVNDAGTIVVRSNGDYGTFSSRFNGALYVLTPDDVGGYAQQLIAGSSLGQGQLGQGLRFGRGISLSADGTLVATWDGSVRFGQQRLFVFKRNLTSQQYVRTGNVGLNSLLRTDEFGIDIYDEFTLFENVGSSASGLIAIGGRAESNYFVDVFDPSSASSFTRTRVSAPPDFNNSRFGEQVDVSSNGTLLVSANRLAAEYFTTLVYEQGNGTLALQRELEPQVSSFGFGGDRPSVSDTGQAVIGVPSVNERRGAVYLYDPLLGSCMMSLPGLPSTGSCDPT